MAEPFVNPFPIPMPPVLDYTQQAIQVPGSGKPGATPIYVSSAYPHLPRLDSDPRFPKTAYALFNMELETSRDKQCLGRRLWDPATGDWEKKYSWMTYKEVDEARTRVGSGLVQLWKEGTVGGESVKGWTVGIWSSNRPEWQFASQACSAYSLIMVSLYDTLGPDVVEYCINHSSARVIFASPAHIPHLLKLAKACATIKVIVCMDSWADIEAQGARPGVKGGDVLRAWGKDVGVKVMDLAELEQLGVENPQPHLAPGRKDIASICYTSGTTGNPKGAVLLHETLAAASVANQHGGGPLDLTSVSISYMPLSHIYQRFAEDITFTGGASIGYSCGDNLRLLEDVAILQPTAFYSVPRVLNRVYQALKAATLDAPGFKGALLRKAFADKLYNLREHNQLTHAFWDRVVFKKIRAVLGGNVQFIVSGSAPINPDVLDFLKVAFSCEVVEGYAQTENCGTAIRCWTGDNKSVGTCGPPAAGVEVKLVDVPELGYFSTDKPHPRGEICTRGEIIIPYYYNDEAKSKEAIDADGWLHSGDISSVDEVGRFKIIDRIKNLVKLSHGEYVALEKVENTYSLCPLIAQLYIHADSIEDHVVAVIVPDPLRFAPLASKVLGKQISETDVAAMADAAEDREVILAVAAELSPYADKARLLGFERINNDLHISFEPFTMENELLTPTLKTKRNVAAKVYRKEIDALYAARPKKVAKL